MAETVATAAQCIWSRPRITTPSLTTSSTRSFEHLGAPTAKDRIAVGGPEKTSSSKYRSGR